MLFTKLKRFLRHIAIYALSILGIAVIVEWIAGSIPNSYTYKRDYMETHAGEIRTLILGSSYAYDGLAPTEWAEAFNLANSSQTVEDDYRLLAKYIDSMDSLQTVILGVGYGTMADQSEQYRRTYYTIYMDLYPRWPLNKYSFEVFNLQLLTKKIIKYTFSRDITRCDSLGQRLGHDAAAAGRSAEMWNKDVQQLIENDRMEGNGLGISGLGISGLGISGLEVSGLVGRNIGYMDSIVTLCCANGVQPVIVNMPSMAEYRAGLPPEQIALQDSILRHFASRAVCIDAAAWPVPADGWYNATHLTREASVLFSRWLTRRVADAFGATESRTGTCK